MTSRFDKVAVKINKMFNLKAHTLDGKAVREIMRRKNFTPSHPVHAAIKAELK